MAQRLHPTLAFLGILCVGCVLLRFMAILNHMFKEKSIKADGVMVSGTCWAISAPGTDTYLLISISYASFILVAGGCPSLF